MVRIKIHDDRGKIRDDIIVHEESLRIERSSDHITFYINSLAIAILYLTDELINITCFWCGTNHEKELDPDASMLDELMNEIWYHIGKYTSKVYT
ncbi:MAG: hypothetical protein GY861_05770 [bacterium]|nr:hypothetical protein [bacterium]